jgi:hypothetical protein
MEFVLAHEHTRFQTPRTCTDAQSSVFFSLGRGFGLVRVAGWHAGDPGSILGRDGLYTFGCIPQRFESASAERLRYIKAFIYLFLFF